MDSLAISLSAFIIILGGAACGMVLRRALPQHHLNDHSKDIVRLGASLLATIVALVLGVMITSAKNVYDAQRNEVRQIAAKLVLLDHQLVRYGPEAHDARELARQATAAMIERIWGRGAVQSPPSAPYGPDGVAEGVFGAIERLSPKDDVQVAVKIRALRSTAALTEARLLLLEHSDAGLPLPLLAVLVLWLTFLLASFTLFSSVNPTNAVVLMIIAFSASAAIFLIWEMSTPFSGLMQIPSTSLQEALGPM